MNFLDLMAHHAPDITMTITARIAAQGNRLTQSAAPLVAELMRAPSLGGMLWFHGSIHTFHLAELNHLKRIPTKTVGIQTVIS